MVPAPTTPAVRIGLVGVSFGTSGIFPALALGEEDVPQGLRLPRLHALDKELPLLEAPFGKGEIDSRLDAVDDQEGCQVTPSLFLQALAHPLK